MTGATFLSAGLGAKRLQMLRQLVPDAEVIGLLANQNSPHGQEQLNDVPAAAKSLGQGLVVLNGSNDQEIDAAFASLAKQRVKALLVAADPSIGACQHARAGCHLLRELPEFSLMTLAGTK